MLVGGEMSLCGVKKLCVFLSQNRDTIPTKWEVHS